MAGEYWDYVARKPRHGAADSNRVTIEIERLANNCQDTLPGTLVDLSRHGIQVLLSEEVRVPEAVRVRIADGHSGFDYQLTADTRWCNPAEPGMSGMPQWSVGCQFDSEADWEVIGELLLNGALSTG